MICSRAFYLSSPAVCTKYWPSVCGAWDGDGKKMTTEVFFSLDVEEKQ